MMRRRFRRRRPQWIFSSRGSLEILPGTPTLDGQPIVFDWLLPPGRAQFMMDTKGRDRMTYHGSHLWLDFWWRNTGASTALQDVDFAVIKTTIFDGETGAADLSQLVGQWDEPQTPATLTTWENEDDDGTNAFLWQHHIKGSTPPNAMVNNIPATAANVLGNNQVFSIETGTTDAGGDSHVCRKFCVTQEWQPDVVIRAKRRLQKGEGILIAMLADQAFTGSLSAHLDLHHRSLGVV